MYKKLYTMLYTSVYTVNSLVEVRSASEGDSFSISTLATELQKICEEWHRQCMEEKRQIQKHWHLDEAKKVFKKKDISSLFFSFQESFISTGAELPHLVRVSLSLSVTFISFESKRDVFYFKFLIDVMLVYVKFMLSLCKSLER